MSDFVHMRKRKTCPKCGAGARVEQTFANEYERREKFYCEKNHSWVWHVQLKPELECELIEHE